MDPKPVRSVELDRRKAANGHMPWAVIPKKDKECLQQEGKTSGIQRRRPSTQEEVAQHQRLWAPNYEGPYTVKHAFSGAALVLVDSERQELKHPVNADVVKLFYP
ncbi:hypothetical protein CR513_55335, partial [Mucuna pruriens]